MTRRPKRSLGRPPLGASGRTKVVTLKLSEFEYDTITAAVERANAELADDDKATISSWLRDHALSAAAL